MTQLSGWEAADNGALSKQFKFEDFHQASNFLQRYTEYCSKVNMTPQWSNVYDRVTVHLHNSEFGGVTQKEVACGQHLDMLSQKTLDQDVEEVLTLGDVLTAARIEHDSLVNDQSKRTSLFRSEQTEVISQKQLRLN